MAGHIEQRGENSFRLTVTRIDPMTGKRIRHRKTVKGSKRQAEKELVLFAAEVEKGEHAANVDNLSLAQFSQKWVDEYARKNLAPKTLQSYLEQLNYRIIPALGNMKIRDIQPLHIIKFYNELDNAGRLDGKEGGLSGRTKNYIHRIISSMLNDAVQWQLIPSNPASRVEPPKAKKKKASYYDEEQTVKLLKCLHSEEIKWRTIVYIAIFTGMRRGEIMGLEWQDIDLEKGIIKVERTSQYVHGVGVITKSPKNDSSIQTIMISSTLIGVLKQYKSWHNEQRLSVGNLWKGSNRLFTTWDGDPMFPDSITKWFSKFIKRHSLPHITFHGLRHTSATILINEGLNIKAISARLGHADTTTTLNIYSHALQSADKEAANRLDKIFTLNEEKEAK